MMTDFSISEHDEYGKQDDFVISMYSNDGLNDAEINERRQTQMGMDEGGLCSPTLRSQMSRWSSANQSDGV